MKTVDLLSNLRTMFREAETYSQAGSETETIAVLDRMVTFLNDNIPDPEPTPAAAPESPEPPEQETETPGSAPG